MNPFTPRPSLRKIIMNDYGSVLLMTAIVVSWGLFFGSKAFGGLPTRHGVVIPHAEGGAFGYRMAIVATVVGAPLLVWRVSTYLRLLSFGRVVEATIVEVWFDKDRGRIEFSYTFEGQQLRAGNPVMKNKDTRDLRVGDRVQVVIDTEKPKRAVILQVYCASSS